MIGIVKEKLLNKTSSMKPIKQNLMQPESTAQGLSERVEEVMRNYFKDLDGHDTSDLYDLVISQVEKPLFEVALENYNGNISRAAKALGLNRGTVQGRLKKYDLIR